MNFLSIRPRWGVYCSNSFFALVHVIWFIPFFIEQEKLWNVYRLRIQIWNEPICRVSCRSDPHLNFTSYTHAHYQEMRKETLKMKTPYKSFLSPQHYWHRRAIEVELHVAIFGHWHKFTRGRVKKGESCTFPSRRSVRLLSAWGNGEGSCAVGLNRKRRVIHPRYARCFSLWQ